MTPSAKPGRVSFEVRTDEGLRDYMDEIARRDRPDYGRYQHNISRNATINRIFRILRLFGIENTEQLREALKGSSRKT